MKIATTALAKYAFMDIVDYTKNRSVEAQADIIDALNALVFRVCEQLKIPKAERLMLPTGDGMCIAFLNYNYFDINMIFSLKLLEQIEERNQTEPDEARRFNLRIGINENQDNLIKDINNTTNLAGSGINFAQRVMSLADASQILLGRASFEVLRSREFYMKHFREFSAFDKHGEPFQVYQFVDKELDYLNSERPLAFIAEEVTDFTKLPLTALCAWTIAIASKKHEFLYARKEEPRFAPIANTLLFHLASDEISRQKSTPFKRHNLKTYKAGLGSLEDQYNYYKSQDSNLIDALADLIAEKHYKMFDYCFEGDLDHRTYAFPTPEGLQKLRDEFPNIEEELKALTKVSSA